MILFTTLKSVTFDNSYSYFALSIETGDVQMYLIDKNISQQYKPQLRMYKSQFMISFALYLQES